MSPPETISLRSYMVERFDKLENQIAGNWHESQKKVDRIYNELRTLRSLLDACRGRCDKERSQVWASVDTLKVQHAEQEGKIQGLDKAAVIDAAARNVTWVKVAGLAAACQVVIILVAHFLKF